MILSDYHLHSEFSGDSIQNIDELILKAISMGLEEIAITYGGHNWKMDIRFRKLYSEDRNYERKI